MKNVHPQIRQPLTERLFQDKVESVDAGPVVALDQRRRRVFGKFVAEKIEYSLFGDVPSEVGKVFGFAGDDGDVATVTFVTRTREGQVVHYTRD